MNFAVSLPVAEAWAVLTDVEKIAPCLPGIWLQQVAGDEYQGVVKVKVGPVRTSFQGVARFLLLDASSHKAVLKAEGQEVRGQGKSSAIVTASLFPSGEGTRVEVVTALSVEGRLAHLADGVMAAASRSLIAEFEENLQMTVAGAARSASAASGAETPAIEADGDAAEATTKPREVPAGSQAPPERMDRDPVYQSLEEHQPLARRLAPYMSLAGLLLVARIVFNSLRQRRPSPVQPGAAKPND